MNPAQYFVLALAEKIHMTQLARLQGLIPKSQSLAKHNSRLTGNSISTTDLLSTLSDEPWSRPAPQL
jgi:hypothetical protein